MNIELSHDKRTGRFRLTYKRHVFVAAGLLFITGGIATLNGPRWLPILEAALGKSGLPVNPDHHLPIGFALILLGLSLLYYKHYHLDAKQNRLKSDKRAIQSANIDPSQIRHFFRNLVDDHSYRSSHQSHFHASCNHFLVSENSLQDPQTRVLYEKYAKSSNDLEVFVAKNFWIFPKERPSDGDYRYCLAPHMNMDREMLVYDREKVAEYTALSSELHTLVNQTSEAFEKFIANIASHGHLNRATA